MSAPIYQSPCSGSFALVQTMTSHHRLPGGPAHAPLCVCTAYGHVRPRRNGLLGAPARRPGSQGEWLAALTEALELMPPARSSWVQLLLGRAAMEYAKRRAAVAGVAHNAVHKARVWLEQEAWEQGGKLFSEALDQKTAPPRGAAGDCSGPHKRP